MPVAAVLPAALGAVGAGISAAPEIGAALGIGSAAAGAGISSAAADAAVSSGLAGAASFGGAAAGLPAVGGTAAAAGSGLSLGTALSAAGGAAGLAGAGLSAAGQLNQAKYQQELGTVENEEEQQKANQDTAAAERQEIQQDRQTQLVLSRATADAAAGGGSASDPGVVNLEGQIAQQGAYNAMSALYGGQSKAAQDTYQGQIDLFQGQQAATAAPIAAAGTILSGVSSFFGNRALLSYYRQNGGLPGYTPTAS